MSGSIFCSIRLTDLIARLTNTAIATMATAMITNEAAIITITQNIGSLVFICRSAMFILLIVYALVVLVAAEIRSFNASGHFGLPLFFLVRLLAGVDRGGNRSALAHRCFASALGHVADSARRLRVQFTGAVARRFVVFAGAVAQV